MRTNVFVRDLDLGVVDTSLPRSETGSGHDVGVPLDQRRRSKPRTTTTSGVCLEVARRRKEARYKELAGDGGRARMVVLAGEVGGRFSAETASSSVVWLQRKYGTCPSPCKAGPTRRGCDGGVQFWHAPRPGLLHSPP